MRARVSRWGNSLAIRLPRTVADELGVKEGESVELRMKEGAVVIRASKRPYRLADLLRQITPDNVPDAVEFSPIGKESL
jgi:antitoxin MazE